MAVSFYFLTFEPTFASRPTHLGFWANRVWLRICLYLWKSVFMRFVFDDQKSGKFQTMSGHSDGRCSCSVYIWFYAQKADYPNGLPLCVTDDYINSTAWVLRCLVNKYGYSRTSSSGTGKCQVPRSFIYRFTIINWITTCRLREPIGNNKSRNKNDKERKESLWISYDDGLWARQDTDFGGKQWTIQWRTISMGIKRIEQWRRLLCQL